MTEENIGKIAADFAVSITPAVASKASKKIKSGANKVSNKLRIGVTKYLDKIYQKCSKTKTLLYADKAVNITDIYVNAQLKHGELSLNDNELVDQILTGRTNAIVSGIAGCGKSMMMKHVTLEVIRRQSSKIPIFFELRSINKDKSLPLQKHLWHSLELTVDEFPEDKFEDALQRGMFIFILDGFDELDKDVSDEIEKQLRQLYFQFPKNSFLISSRPDAKLNASVELDVFHVEKMSLSQVSELISKLNYDPERKAAFITDLHKHLYQEHEDFLSSPLLASMMLITYRQFATIPEKIHVFYSQVYEVLFSRHDVAKDGNYTRQFITNLAMDDFSRLFQAFSAISYLDKNFEFDQVLALSTCQQAIDHTSTNVEKRELLNDLLDSVCLLIKDGNKILYTHRSFQEYFTALFMASLSDSNFQIVGRNIERRMNTDEVMFLLFGMQQERVERLFILPFLNDIIQKLEGDNMSIIAKKFFEELFPQMFFHPNRDSAKQLRQKNSVPMSTSNDKGALIFSTYEYYKYLLYVSNCYPDEFEKCLDHDKDPGGPGADFVFPRLIMKGHIFENPENRTYEKKEIITAILERYDIVQEANHIYEALKSLKDNIQKKEETINTSLLGLLKES